MFITSQVAIPGAESAVYECLVVTCGTDTDGHIVRHKARVRLFCLAFLSGASPTLEVGVNDRRRRGREVVGRRDIVPIKTEAWIHVEPGWRLHGAVDAAEFERSRLLTFVPLDACRYELMRFRVRPRPNVELPLQVRVQMSVVDRHVEIRAEVSSRTRTPHHATCSFIELWFCRGTARCVVSVEILPIATQQCRNYLYDKS